MRSVLICRLGKQGGTAEFSFVPGWMEEDLINERRRKVSMAKVRYRKNWPAYHPQSIEPKWQKFWEEAGLHLALETGDKPKFYCLDFFPYPSGDGLHVGHCRNYVPTDVTYALHANEGLQCAAPHGLGRLRRTCRAVRGGAWRAPAPDNRPQYRQLPPPDDDHRHQLRLDGARSTYRNRNSTAGRRPFSC